MKKLLLGLVALFAVSVVSTSCSGSKNDKVEPFADGVYTGSFVEATQWATYTADVKVTVEKAKIAKVELEDSTSLHSPAANWADHAAWTDHYTELLNSYKGLSAAKVATSKAAPVDALAGATLSSDRLYQAVKNALAGVADGVYNGIFEESTGKSSYKAEVNVTVKDGKIEKVELLSTDEIHSSTSKWSGHTAWTEHYTELLADYEGLWVVEVTNSETAPVDALVGASQSSERLYQAVKNALLG